MLSSLISQIKLHCPEALSCDHGLHGQAHPEYRRTCCFPSQDPREAARCLAIADGRSLPGYGFRAVVIRIQGVDSDPAHGSRVPPEGKSSRPPEAPRREVSMRSVDEESPCRHQRRAGSPAHARCVDLAIGHSRPTRFSRISDSVSYSGSRAPLLSSSP